MERHGDPARVASALESPGGGGACESSPDDDLLLPLGADAVVEFVIRTTACAATRGARDGGDRDHGRMSGWRAAARSAPPLRGGLIETGASHLIP